MRIVSVTWDGLLGDDGLEGLSGRSIFLDTSAQVERLIGLENRRAALELIGADRLVFCSSTVWREFQVSFLQAYQFVADSVRHMSGNASTRMGEVARHVASEPGVYGPRRAQRILTVLSLLMDDLGDTEPLNSVDVADFCEGEIRRFRDRRFFCFDRGPISRDIRTEGTYLDEVACSVAVAPLDPAKPSASMISCDKVTRRCEVRPLLGRARSCFASLPKEWHDRRPGPSAAAGRVLQWADNDLVGDKAIGQKLCWQLADIVIAHECPDDAVLVTTDADFRSIAPLIGLDVIHIRR